MGESTMTDISNIASEEIGWKHGDPGPSPTEDKPRRPWPGRPWIFPGVGKAADSIVETGNAGTESQAQERSCDFAPIGLALSGGLGILPTYL